MERLQKLIAESGFTSRRKAEELIVSGKVKVDGNVVTELGTKVNKDVKIEIDGKILKLEQKEYYLLNKPTSSAYLVLNIFILPKYKANTYIVVSVHPWIVDDNLPIKESGPYIE